jgi:hypothetical protein
MRVNLVIDFWGNCNLLPKILVDFQNHRQKKTGPSKLLLKINQRNQRSPKKNN